MTMVPARRGGRGLYPRSTSLQQHPGSKGRNERPLPEYLSPEEVASLLHHAPHGPARLLMLFQWRAGLRVSEALALTGSDCRTDGDLPVVIVRHGKGGKNRHVSMHPELAGAINAAAAYQRELLIGRLFTESRSTAWRWAKEALAKAVQEGEIAPGRKVATHTLRHSCARHMLANGYPINELQLFLGHASLETTLIYLRILPDANRRIESIP